MHSDGQDLLLVFLSLQSDDYWTSEVQFFGYFKYLIEPPILLEKYKLCYYKDK